jgi:phosphatidate cytidylyltransferase
MSDDEEAGNGADDGRDGLGRLGADWTTRLVWGLVMAAAAAALLFAGPIPFYGLVVVVTLLLSWEWTRLVHGGSADALMAVHLGASGLAAILAAMGWPALGLLALLIGAILAMLLTLGRSSGFAALGVLYAGLPAVAIIWLRSDAVLGLPAVLFLIAVVVATDTAAFLAGRLIGGRKLWPRVSPNKTWAGLLGAVAASVLVGAAFGLSLAAASPWRLALVGAGLAVVAQAGDLAESALKRRFGAKDSSALIPGHGGVMDRVDGLVAAATAVGLAAFVVNVHSPAHALLVGS